MYCGPTAYTWKIAFDSEFAKYSAGRGLIDKLTEQLFTTTDVQAIDSCSAEGSFMAQLWTGRKTMVDAVIDVGSTRSLVFALEAARLYGYERLRDLPGLAAGNVPDLGKAAAGSDPVKPQRRLILVRH